MSHSQGEFFRSLLRCSASHPSQPHASLNVSAPILPFRIQARAAATSAGPVVRCPLPWPRLTQVDGVLNHFGEQVQCGNIGVGTVVVIDM
jgi:hypothetical protein